MTSFTGADRERTVAALTQAVQEFAVARDWGQFHDPKNLVMSLASEVGELAAFSGGCVGRTLTRLWPTANTATS